MAGSKNVFKCGLCRPSWTRSATTDIRLFWPACFAWAPQVSQDGAVFLEERFRGGSAIVSKYGDEPERDRDSLLPLADELEEAGFQSLAWYYRRLAGLLTIESVI